MVLFKYDWMLANLTEAGALFTVVMSEDGSVSVFSNFAVCAHATFPFVDTAQ
jgi:hypothetical protein